MKFLHVADLHMDRPFEGLGPVNQELSLQLAQSNLEMLEGIVNHGIEQKVDFILIVGDTFHQPHVTIRMQAYFLKELERLNQAGIAVILTFGNHDYYQAERYWFDFPGNVYLWTSEEIQSQRLTTKLGEIVEFTGFSYEHRWLDTTKVSEFPKRSSEVDYQIGMYHGQQLNSLEETNHYAPFSLSEMKNKGYDYWALGHIHQPQMLAEHPLISYPGTPQGHTKKENQVRGALLVDMSGGGTTYRWLSVDKVQWQQFQLDITGKLTRPELLEKLALFLWEQKTTKMLLVELVLQGATPEIMTDLQRELGNRELLEFLQQKIYQQTDGKVWLYQLIAAVSTDVELNLPLGVDLNLLEYLGTRYCESANFEETIKTTFGQSVLAGQKMDPKVRVEAAQKKIIKELGWNEEEK